MYSAQPNGADSATINPAALNSSGESLHCVPILRSKTHTLALHSPMRLSPPSFTPFPHSSAWLRNTRSLLLLLRAFPSSWRRGLPWSWPPVNLNFFVAAMLTYLPQQYCILRHLDATSGAGLRLPTTHLHLSLTVCRGPASRRFARPRFRSKRILRSCSCRRPTFKLTAAPDIATSTQIYSLHMAWPGVSPTLMVCHSDSWILGEASLRRRRDRSMKKSEASGQAPASSTTSQSNQQPPQPPQAQGASQPNQPAPAYATNLTTAPPKTTPTKSTLKALPTVRDHTTDQLNSTSDEYLPREIDEFGEKKVMANGQLLGNRQYRCRTFLVPNRGDKLFMLATECARVLGYRDSYLLFNKNRSLYKIIASQAEKDDLVQQEILPFSYRSRQIAIVTARSMFRQFGSRVIENGRRVRDDYWETKARKQGFTEADAAGEKRPGAAKAREAAEAQNTALISGAPPEIVYNNHPGPYPGATQPHLVQPGMMGAPPGSAPRMPGLTVGSEFSDTRPRDFSGIIKGGPRQEITGPAYQDQTRSSAGGEINSQAHHAADFNRSVNQQRDMRSEYMQGIWRRPHEQPASSSLSQSVNSNDTANVPTSRPSTSPHTTSAGVPPHQPAVVSSQSPQVMMAAPPYSPSVHSQNTMGPASMRGS